MEAMMQHLDNGYRRRVTEKWSKFLDAGGGIQNAEIRANTAMVLENTQRQFDAKKQLLESAPTGAMAAGSAGVFGSTTDYAVTDARVPTTVMALLRRTFPDYIAHELVGVQPMNGPLGYAWAYRVKYGKNGLGQAGGTVSEGTEIGYNTVDTRFTGTSGLAALSTAADYGATVSGTAAIDPASAYWTAFAGTYEDGMGQTLANGEWQALGTDMPMSTVAFEKGIVQAKTRKLGAIWSLEAAEDIKAMQGIDLNGEMANNLTYEIKAEIDRQLLAEMVKAAISGSQVSTWTPVSADGRNQQERIGTLYTHIQLKKNLIGKNTRIAPANWMVGSPTACALLETLGRNLFDGAGSGVKTDSNVGGVTKVGSFMSNSLQVYRDTLAAGDYLLLGLKGSGAGQAGVIYCPYIPVEMMQLPLDVTGAIKMGVRTRYGMLSNLFGSSYFYQMIRLADLSATALSDSGSRIFLQ